MLRYLNKTSDPAALRARVVRFLAKEGALHNEKNHCYYLGEVKIWIPDSCCRYALEYRSGTHSGRICCDSIQGLKANVKEKLRELQVK